MNEEVIEYNDWCPANYNNWMFSMQDICIDTYYGLIHPAFGEEGWEP